MKCSNLKLPAFALEVRRLRIATPLTAWWIGTGPRARFNGLTIGKDVERPCDPRELCQGVNGVATLKLEPNFDLIAT